MNILLEPSTYDGLSSRLSTTTSPIVETIQFPRRHFMPYEATPFDKDGTVLYSVASTNVDILSFTLPLNSRGVIKGIGQGAATGDTALVFGTGNTVWTLLINGVPVVDWGNVTLQRGTVQIPSPVTIDLSNGSNIVMRISSPDTNFRVYTRLVGWYWTDDAKKE